MTYRSDNVERMSTRPPIAAEVIALQRASESCQERPWTGVDTPDLLDYLVGASNQS
jgi:hypothetical protein